MLLVTSTDIAANLKRVHTHTEAFARELNCQCLMLDDIPSDVAIKNIDYNSYKGFKYNYITNPDSENVSNADILMKIYNGEIQ